MDLLTEGGPAMNEPSKHAPLRREFLAGTGRMAAASALAGAAVPHVHAQASGTIQLALVGCGGRGTGATENALSVKNGPIKLVAMADIFDNRLKGSYNNLSRRFAAQVDVPEDRKFVGFDGYKKAMDCLKAGDVVILATPPAFRWVHFGRAIEKGLHVFMEKPVTVDGPTTRRMLKLAEASVKKNLKVGVGLMVRHCRGRLELLKRIQSGEIGDLVVLRGYRMGGPAGTCGAGPKGAGELLHQIRAFHAFLWASGGIFSDFCIHQIDECCWMKGAWPVRAMAVGGRHYRGESVDQNLDTYSIEYQFADGTLFYYYHRNMPKCHSAFESFAHGTKGAAVISTWMHTPGKVRTYKGHQIADAPPLWAFPQPEPDPYQLEWVDLIDAIRQDKPYNEAERGAVASLVTSMGRMAAHTGRIITYDEILNCKHEFAPDLDKLTADSPAPLQAESDGKYPVPMPGKKALEY
jgi:predicted dehydrogenase